MSEKKSEWELVDFSSAPDMMQPQSEWELDQPKMPQESLLAALMQAPGRIGSDIGQGISNFIQQIPAYYEKAQTEVPGFFQNAIQHPGSMAQQGIAGLAELGQKTFNLPHDIANYASNRLNIIPENINAKVQMGRMPADTQEMINQTFGEPKYSGEAFARGTMRNIPEIGAAKSVTSFINPLNYTSKSITKDILKEEARQVKQHSKDYNKLWSDADKKGFGNVTYDPQKLQTDFAVIEKYKTPREYQSLENFMNNPTLKNAQKAQSDMNFIRRNLSDKSRSGSLTSEERALFKAAESAEDHIEANMFKNKSGKISETLKNRYDKITSSYRDNVVPYKYNPDLQAYKAKELLPKELTEKLSRGEFAAKKGSMHPELFWPQRFKNAAITAALIGGGGVGMDKMYDLMYGTK